MHYGVLRNREQTMVLHELYTAMLATDHYLVWGDFPDEFSLSFINSRYFLLHQPIFD